MCVINNLSRAVEQLNKTFKLNISPKTITEEIDSNEISILEDAIKESHEKIDRFLIKNDLPAIILELVRFYSLNGSMAATLSNIANYIDTIVLKFPKVNFEHKDDIKELLFCDVISSQFINQLVSNNLLIKSKYPKKLQLKQSVNIYLRKNDYVKIDERKIEVFNKHNEIKIILKVDGGCDIKNTKAALSKLS
ncbi:MAG: hypothetical protein ACOYT8_00530 [Candidatus Dependentiae bacterium]